ncbi:MAG: hypothetical protein OES46_07630 [Gammaproteobacteria bacterium]|jgi:hypothetical protein|nr:hypothetical protein [Gammaproteobacteria bacterium]
MKKILAIYSVAFIAVTLSLPVTAADLGNWERFAINVGTFVTDNNTEMRLDATSGALGTTLDFEDQLGLDEDEDVTRLDGFWRYGKRSRLDFSFFTIDRDANRPVTLTINWGDETFTAGTPLRTQWELDITKLAYTYSFVRNPKLDVGITGGFHVMDIRARLTDSTTGDFDEGDETAPLPVIGARVAYRFTPEWVFTASSEWFGIEADDIDGRLLDTRIGIEHNTFKNVGFGGGFNTMDFDLDSDDKGDSGSFDMTYEGFQIYAKAYF